VGLKIRHDGFTWILTHLKIGPNGFINRGPRPNIKFGGLHGARLALKQNTTNFKCFPIRSKSKVTINVKVLGPM
jgi:hypothetical protein